MSSKSIIVAGYGPGISSAVAETFGALGFSVALVARNAERLAAGVASLTARGVRAAAVPADLGAPGAARAVVARVRAELGPIGILSWNVYPSGAGTGDLLTASDAAIAGLFDVPVAGLLAAVQEALPDLRGDGAVLVTNGGLGALDPRVDAMSAQRGLMGLAVGNAAKHKLVGLLAERLRADGVYVGEVMVNGTVIGSAFDSGHGTLPAQDVAKLFLELYRGRAQTYAQIG